MAQDDSPGAADSPRRRSGLLRDQVQLVRKKDSDSYEVVPIQEPLSFEKGFFVFIRACQLLAQKNDGLILVGVAGPSGAGKTVFTEKVLNFMPSIAVVRLDNYNDSSRIIDGNFDDPRLTDYETLLENIHGLKAGKPVQVPTYDFKSSSRIGYRTLEVPSSRIVIIEGIYALSEKLRPLLDLRVSVTGGVHFDLVKRVLRDIQRAGQEPEEIIQQISETVYPMYKAFIEPDLQTAHIKIINKFNPFTGFQNPTYILKSTKRVSDKEIKAAFPGYFKESVEETYDIYLLPPGEDPDACQSYLRMRNRDGKYNLMFEEWVTDSPFIISPRMTFEVRVRLLGGLMALGYTIASILKRSSHIFSDDRVCVKTDWLEQLNRHYVQVQGKDRMYVKHVAEQIGLEGAYVPRTYIEQIQLEKLTNDIYQKKKLGLSHISPLFTRHLHRRVRRTISYWKKGQLLGRGSFGSVYEGIADDGFFFAVKEVALHDQGARESILQLEQEIALLSQFEHENIVQYYGTEKDEGNIYIFLELVTKGSLLNLYHTYRLRDSQVSAYTRQILNGLMYLHDRNVVHRDIKCANILVDASGSVKLADFGLAKATSLNDVKSCKGTVFWMAPEVVRANNHGYGLPADIWSLGCTVLEMLTQQLPYYPLELAQAVFRIGKGEPPPVQDTLSADARDFILRCVQVNPGDRPTAAQLMEHPFVKWPPPVPSGSSSPRHLARRFTS